MLIVLQFTVSLLDNACANCLAVLMLPLCLARIFQECPGKSDLKYFRVKFETSQLNMFKIVEIECLLFYFDLDFFSKKQ